MIIFKKYKTKFLIGVIIISGMFFINSGKTDENNNNPKNIKIIAKMYAQDKQRFFPGIKDILVEDLAKFSKSDLLFLDIRDKKEQDVSMIPGAITQKEFEQNIDEYKNKKIILYCTIGNRSGKYAVKLAKRKIEAYNLIGGILAWAWEGLPLENVYGPTTAVHVYGPRWNLLPDNYKPVW